MKHWPLKDQTPMFPDEPGRFRAMRRHDCHTGIDLYCELGQKVIAIEDGTVVTVEPFTGKNAGCVWWNDTEAVLILGESGVFNYGEVIPLVKEGDKVKAGQVIAVVDTAVLKNFKGRPMVMLHLELLSHESDTSPWWYITSEGELKLKKHRIHRNDGAPKMGHIWDPEVILKEIAGETLTSFELSKYDGKKYKDPEAPEKDSAWWSIWRKS